MNARRLALALLVAAWSARVCLGQVPMLFPEKHSVRKGETVTFTYQWGQPFKHQLSDAPAPEGVRVVAPDRKTTTYPADYFQRIARPGAGNQKATAFQFSYKPEARGDYVFWMQLPPVWLEDKKQYLQDSVKVVLHVEEDGGWENLANWDYEWQLRQTERINKGLPANVDDRAIRADWEVQPLTRPYGLTPNMVFQARPYHPPVELPRMPMGERGLPQVREMPSLGSQFAVERYNPAPPPQLPADEFIVRTARADSNGVVTTTLTEAGWWRLTVPLDDEGKTMRRDDKEYPLKRRTSFWVYVNEKAQP